MLPPPINMEGVPSWSTWRWGWKFRIGYGQRCADLLRLRSCCDSLCIKMYNSLLCSDSGTEVGFHWKIWDWKSTWSSWNFCSIRFIITNSCARSQRGYNTIGWSCPWWNYFGRCSSIHYWNVFDIQIWLLKRLWRLKLIVWSWSCLNLLVPDKFISLRVFDRL